MNLHFTDTTGKIESEMKEMKEKLGFLTASVEKSTAEGQLMGTVIRKTNQARTGTLSHSHWAEVVIVVLGSPSVHQYCMIVKFYKSKLVSFQTSFYH